MWTNSKRLCLESVKNAKKARAFRLKPTGPAVPEPPLYDGFRSVRHQVRMFLRNLSERKMFASIDQSLATDSWFQAQEVVLNVINKPG